MRVWGKGFRVLDLVFRDQGLGIKVYHKGVRAWDLSLEFRV